MFNNWFKKYKNTKSFPIPMEEYNRLRRLPRYKPVQTKLYGHRIFSNDACTLIEDIKSILVKEVYCFRCKTSKPIIIDCGSNIGISLIYFKKLFPDAEVIAFEPDPDLFDLLCQNMKSFGFDNTTIEQKAVWINDDGVSFRQEGGHSGTIVEDSVCESVVKVPAMRLRDLLDTYDAVDMLKIDIEGAEAHVLFDCGDLLSKCHHVFVEYHSAEGRTQCLHSILEMMSKLNFRYHVQDAFTREKPFIDRTVMLGMDLQLNLFFFRET